MTTLDQEWRYSSINLKTHANGSCRLTIPGVPGFVHKGRTRQLALATVDDAYQAWVKEGLALRDAAQVLVDGANQAIAAVPPEKLDDEYGWIRQKHAAWRYLRNQPGMRHIRAFTRRFGHEATFVYRNRLIIGVYRTKENGVVAQLEHPADYPV